MMGGYKYISFFAKMKTVDIKIELMKMKKLKKNFKALYSAKWQNKGISFSLGA